MEKTLDTVDNRFFELKYFWQCEALYSLNVMEGLVGGQAYTHANIYCTSIKAVPEYRGNWGD
jgi:hypothetical protein